MGLKELRVRFLQDMDNTMSIECSCLFRFVLEIYYVLSHGLEHSGIPPGQ